VPGRQLARHVTSRRFSQRALWVRGRR
jgi:hypothetical protein